MAERLGTGLQNQVQRFESAWNLRITKTLIAYAVRVFSFVSSHLRFRNSMQNKIAFYHVLKKVIHQFNRLGFYSLLSLIILLNQKSIL